DDSRGARCADRFRPAERNPAHRAGGPRPSRTADQGRLCGQERAHFTEGKRARQADRDRRHRRGLGRYRPRITQEVLMTTKTETPIAPAAQPSTVSTLRHKDLLGIADLTPEEILLILDTAEAMREIG